MNGLPLLAIRRLEKRFPVAARSFGSRQLWVRAVDRVDLDIREAETVGLVGESGSGKTTLGRCAMRLIDPSAGVIRFRGEDLARLKGAELRRHRRHFQMIFQDAYASLDPRMRIADILAEPLVAHTVVSRQDLAAEVRRLLGEVGLTEDTKSRLPHELSGGQQQRVGIARALAVRPDLVVADEPVSALDVSVRANIIDLLIGLRAEKRLALLFIAHDLATVGQIADRVAVLYLGRIVESGPTAELFEAPLHPYTAALISATPVADPDSQRQRIVLPGEPPDPVSPPAGCPFHPRCPIARNRCRSESPPRVERSTRREVWCHYPGELEPTARSFLQAGTF